MSQCTTATCGIRPRLGRENLHSYRHSHLVHLKDLSYALSLSTPVFPVRLIAMPLYAPSADNLRRSDASSSLAHSQTRPVAVSLVTFLFRQRTSRPLPTDD